MHHRPLAIELLKALHLIELTILLRISYRTRAEARVDDSKSCLSYSLVKERRRRVGADRGRTDDLRLAKPALSQLSYSPEMVSEWA
jgi:hypothetical protein